MTTRSTTQSSCVASFQKSRRSLRQRQSSPFLRRLGLEPLEQRTLLSVGAAGPEEASVPWDGEVVSAVAEHADSKPAEPENGTIIKPAKGTGTKADPEDLNYTITATGTEDVTTYPDESTQWTVQGTATETWFEIQEAKDTEEGLVDPPNNTEMWRRFPPSADPAIAPFDCEVEWVITLGAGSYGGEVGKADASIYVDEGPPVVSFSQGDLSSSTVKTWRSSDPDQSTFPVSAGQELFGRVHANDFGIAKAEFTYVVSRTQFEDQAERTATNGPHSGTVSKEDGEKFMGVFTSKPLAEEGGAMGPTWYDLIDETDPEHGFVWVEPDTAKVYAYTSHEVIGPVPWSEKESGSATVVVAEGEQHIATSSLHAPNGDTSWSVVDDNDRFNTWMMNGPELWASSILDMDLGDAPDASYPTRFSGDGARHAFLPEGPFMGAAVDSETDGHPDVYALGDDHDGTDDEDGVTFPTLLMPGNPASGVKIDMSSSPADGLLNAWIDFNHDGDWADAGEQIFTDVPLASGGENPLNLNFDVPSSAAFGPTYARFRVNTAGGLSYSGFAEDGEVEDYLVTIGDKPPFLTVDINNDNDGQDELVVDFGAPWGIYMWENNSTWRYINQQSADLMVAGNIDGNGRDDLIVDFGEPGIWIRYDIGHDNGEWVQLHETSPKNIVTGDIDNFTDAETPAMDEVIVDFGVGVGLGLWVYYPATGGWTHLDERTADTIICGDLDGQLGDELVVVFGDSDGIWARYNNDTTWKPLHEVSPRFMVVGNMNNQGGEDLIADFGEDGTAPDGIWYKYDDSVWIKRHSQSSTFMVTGNLDDQPPDELVVDFGDPDGIWVRYNDDDWRELHKTSPSFMAVGNLDGQGPDDLIVDFWDPHGLWVRYNDTGWERIHAGPQVTVEAPEAGQRELELSFGNPVDSLSETVISLAEDNSEPLPLDHVELNADGKSAKLIFAQGLMAGNYTLTVSGNVTDLYGNPWELNTEAVFVVLPAVTSRYIFYNDSAFDGNDSAASEQDDLAIATDKLALLPMQTATAANYTSYSRGINGVLVDIDGLVDPDGLDADDFQFRVGNINDPESWQSTAAPTEIHVRADAGAGGSDRVGLVWEDEAVVNGWLEVTVLATDNTGLADPDIFYFANMTGDADSDGAVDLSDFNLWNATKFTQVGLDAVADFDRSGAVDLSDFNLWNAHKFTSLATATDPVPPDVAGQELDDPTGAFDELAWLRELEQDRSKRSSDESTLAARAVDRLLATYWD